MQVPFAFSVGDKYILTDIVPPSAYITDAESRLYGWARYTEYPAKSSINNIADVEIDEFYLRYSGTKYYITEIGQDPIERTWAAFYLPGDILNINTEIFTGLLQVISLEKDMSRETAYKLTLGINKPIGLGLTLLNHLDKLKENFRKSSANKFQAIQQYGEK